MKKHEQNFTDKHTLHSSKTEVYNVSFNDSKYAKIAILFLNIIIVIVRMIVFKMIGKSDVTKIFVYRVNCYSDEELR